MTPLAPNTPVSPWAKPQLRCPTKVFFTDPDTGEKGFFNSYCRKATCPTCKVRRTNLMTAQLYDHMKGRSCWHLTLTIRHKPSPLRPLVTGIHEAFKELRASAVWRNQIVGGEGSSS